MKKPAGKIKRGAKVIGFFFAAAIIYGIFVAPFSENKTPNQPLASIVYTDAPTEAPTAAPTLPPTAAPTPTPTPMPTPTESPTPAPTELPTLRQGDKGEAVKQIQTELIRLGYLSGSADGDFGKKTAQAVKDFQVCNGLKEDGIFGDACWKKINGYYYVSQITVYVSSKGVYHTRANCSGMKKSTKMSLSDAIRKGYKEHSGGCH